MNKSKAPLKSTQIQRTPATTPKVAPQPAPPRPMSSGPATPVQRVRCACGGEVGTDGQCAECRAREVATAQRQVDDKEMGGAMAAPVVQRQADEDVAEATGTQVGQSVLQRQAIKGGGATPGKGEGVDLIFIIRAPDDQFTNDITDYVKTVLEGQTYTEVDNLDDIFDHLAWLKARINVHEVIEPAIKVRRIRIVAHGSTTGDVKMTPRGEKNRRWVTPQEVAAYTQNSLAQATIAQVMAPGAQIEFWGCNIGAVPKSGEAWSQAFQSTFSATSETFKIEFDEYARPADKGEAGEVVPGHKGTWVRVGHTDEIDSHGRGLQTHFSRWLLGLYQQLAASGDILPLKTRAERLTYMRDLFNRAGGKIRHILIERKSDQKQIRPGDQNKWLRLWKATAVPRKP